jgi:CubicO group peptidase (beta-lactamase class C family)
MNPPLRLRTFLLAFALGPLAVVHPSAHAQAYAPPVFTDAARAEKITALLPEITKIYTDYAAEKHAPGLVWGIVLDGQLLHVGRHGFANLEKKIPADERSAFRIASMTKSFAALAILKLRDAGKLSLDDPAEKHLPELRAFQPLTADTPKITLRHLLSMAAGFPEDNPWGDRQLGVTPEQFTAFLAGGVAFSTASGTAFEYSNLGFALLGRVITRVAATPYQTYITREILAPLGMKDTHWEFSAVPAARLALGYRWENKTWKLEPLERDGAYGAMGGLITTADDFTRYVAFHLAAWPPRDEAETGPVRRATVREMHTPTQPTGVNATAKTLSGEPNPIANGYGFGLSVSLDSKGVVFARHSGGLPGFGSEYRFFPDYGFGIFSFANVTYAGTGNANAKVASLLLEKAKLPPRTLPVSKLLAQRTQQLGHLLADAAWDEKLAAEIFAENFFPDRSRADWITHTRTALAQAGKISSVGPLKPLNQLRGTFPLLGEKGRVDVFFTLTPEITPKIQELRLTFVKK